MDCTKTLKLMLFYVSCPTCKGIRLLETQRVRARKIQVNSQGSYKLGCKTHKTHADRYRVCKIIKTLLVGIAFLFMKYSYTENNLVQQQPAGNHQKHKALQYRSCSLKPLLSEQEKGYRQVTVEMRSR